MHNVKMISKSEASSQEAVWQRGTPPVSFRKPFRLMSRAIMALTLAVTALGHPAQASADSQTRFKRIPTQFIAALDDPDASSGTGAQYWGLWRQDPGPRGVWLDDYGQLKAAGDVAPADWKFQPDAWWLEENGRIMEQPDFPIPPGRYVVTGNRQVTSVLTIHPMDANGDQRWELANGATLHDVTHLGCRSALYTPAKGEGSCSPDKAQRTAFPVQPGAAMPFVQGCNKRDYQVLIVIGRIVEN
ncbi:MAG: hypothetical protein WAL83_11620 [Arenicellales bacterium]|jgi:hypothetical protein